MAPESPAERPAKVVATIAPAVSEEAAARAGFDALWRELVETKAKLAMLMNDMRVQQRAMEDLEVYCRRHVKRIDAIASRLTRAERT